MLEIDVGYVVRKTTPRTPPKLPIIKPDASSHLIERMNSTVTSIEKLPDVFVESPAKMEENSGGLGTYKPHPLANKSEDKAERPQNQQRDS